MVEKQRRKPEYFIDPNGNQWIVSTERKPFGDDFYREMRRTENGKVIEMKITESWMNQLTKAREIHLKNQQNPRGRRT